MLRLFLAGLFFLNSFAFAKKEYHREYHSNGLLKSEGWKKGEFKEDFWKFYHPNGKIMEKGHFKHDQKVGYWYFYDLGGRPEMEGHYKQGKMAMWWLFYDEHGKINHKCQLQKGVKNGYCLKYKNEKLTSAEKYAKGKKVKEWFDFRSFKKENKLSDLK
ncbi:toxin-antitoxin system YwqK family antitoxin [Flagellimonas onchidii]|uniref:toxin-antitoxin system YwqK family antitoxin n=1 Tax=Flagellimonas onchidii TaxID=2562684 RepID=UPI0010A5FBBD|nr:hypothetical protein [Allomuricauda onchidii]